MAAGREQAGRHWHALRGNFPETAATGGRRHCLFAPAAVPARSHRECPVYTPQPGLRSLDSALTISRSILKSVHSRSDDGKGDNGCPRSAGSSPLSVCAAATSFIALVDSSQ